MNVTVVVAMIAAIAAIVAPVLTEIISQRNTRKLKQLELFFCEKARVYSNFIQITSRFPPSFAVKEEDLKDIFLAATQASLYSSKGTSTKLFSYAQALINNSNLEEVSNAYYDALVALHLELKRYKK